MFNLLVYSNKEQGTVKMNCGINCENQLRRLTVKINCIKHDSQKETTEKKWNAVPSSGGDTTHIRT